MKRGSFEQQQQSIPTRLVNTNSTLTLRWRRCSDIMCCDCLFCFVFTVRLFAPNCSTQPKTSFEKNCFSAWASTLNMGLINKVDMVCLSPVGMVFS